MAADAEGFAVGGFQRGVEGAPEDDAEGEQGEHEQDWGSVGRGGQAAAEAGVE